MNHLTLPLNSETDWVDAEGYNHLRDLKEQSHRSGRRIIDLSMINPDLPPPRLLLDRLVEASLQTKNHRYSVARGISKLREAVSQVYRSRYGVGVRSDVGVCITLGAKDALLAYLAAVCERGSTVLVPAPTYPAFESSLLLQGVRTLHYRLDGSEEMILSEIERHLAEHPIRVLLCNFPNNPTGRAVSSSFWDRLGSLLAKTDTLLLNDFVYGDLCFSGQPAASALASPLLAERGCEIVSLSKSYSVPGWRIGAVVGLPRVIERISRLKAHLDYGIFMPLQIAAAHALVSQQDIVAPIRVAYSQRCALVAQGLRTAGFAVEEPQAGCCVWAKLPSKAEDADGFTRRLALETGTFLLPGHLFGAEYRRFVRVAVVGADPILREVVDRCSQALTA